MQVKGFEKNLKAPFTLLLDTFFYPYVNLEPDMSYPLPHPLMLQNQPKILAISFF